MNFVLKGRGSGYNTSLLTAVKVWSEKLGLPCKRSLSDSCLFKSSLWISIKKVSYCLHSRSYYHPPIYLYLLWINLIKNYFYRLKTKTLMTITFQMDRTKKPKNLQKLKMSPLCPNLQKYSKSLAQSAKKQRWLNLARFKLVRRNGRSDPIGSDHFGAAWHNQKPFTFPFSFSSLEFPNIFELLSSFIKCLFSS